MQGGAGDGPEAGLRSKPRGAGARQGGAAASARGGVNVSSGSSAHDAMCCLLIMLQVQTPVLTTEADGREFMYLGLAIGNAGRHDQTGAVVKAAADGLLPA